MIIDYNILAWAIIGIVVVFVLLVIYFIAVSKLKKRKEDEAITKSSKLISLKKAYEKKTPY